MTIFRGILALTIGLSAAVPAIAQVPATASVAQGLGERFESRSAGIALHPPAGMDAVRGTLGNGEVVRFIDEDRKWLLKVNRVILEEGKPVPLTTWRDAQGQEHPGMLEFVIEQFKMENPGAQILRSDTIDTGAVRAGMMAAKFSIAMETNLMQQAIVRASDMQYYILAMSSPAPRDGSLEDDPNVRDAVQSFVKTVESVELLDQLELEIERNERLMRTKVLYVNLTERKLRATLQPEQWLRYIRDGKDFGYTYVVEEVGRDLPRKGRTERQTGREGVLIGVRSRMHPPGGTMIDAEAWLFMTFDRKYEAWSNVAVSGDSATGRTTGGELGISRWREKPIPDPVELGAKRSFSLTEEYRLEVTRLGENINPEPELRELPPFYLPQALGQLLPRLVPLREPKGYAFVTWVSDAQQLMYRYLDVEREREVSLGGKRVRAVPIKDRVGIEGSVTTHYLSPEGQYLGSVNEDSRLTILPTDRATLEKLWNNANLSRPGDVDDAK